MAALVWLLDLRQYGLNEAGNVLGFILAGFVIAFYPAASQMGYIQSYLARITWIVTCIVPIWLMWDLFPIYEEAVPHDIFMEHTPGAVYDPANPPAWTPVAMWTYYFMLLPLLANLAWAIYLAYSIISVERKNGITELVSDNLRTNKAAPSRSAMPASKPASQKEEPLATRDIEALKPKFAFDALAGQDELKIKLLDAAQSWDNGGKKDGKNGVFLYGEPGTGKTAFAEALAGEVGLKIMKINIGSMASRYVNQTTEQLQHIIDSALHQAPCVLFLDEVESIFPDRTRIERGDSEESKIVGSFLSSVEKLRAGRVLLVAATNYKDRVDAAAIREGRFDFHIEVAVPDFEARKGLTLNVLKSAGKTVEPAVLDRLARRWAGFNVPRIQEAARRAAGFSATNTVGMAEFMRGLRDVQGNSTGVAEDALSLSDLYFDNGLKARLESLAATFAKSDEIEAKGGSVPKGVAFYGPPGTGKTTMAQALAKASGWAFIATSGKEILSDTNKLREIRRKASDLRPAIVFIDEADDILGDRRMSGMKLHTNELLATIDGAGAPPDVVWIIATNDVDSLDEAVTRRFPTKIELPVPGIEALTRMVRDWAAKRPDMLHGEVEEWSVQVGRALEGLAPSVVKNILDAALNTEAANSVLRGDPMSITLDEVLEARREMRA
jgi:transitional endoplasmic reticulum ATPase